MSSSATRGQTAADPPQPGVEGVRDGELVIQLQFADNPLQPVERRLVPHDREDTFALDLGSSLAR